MRVWGLLESAKQENNFVKNATLNTITLSSHVTDNEVSDYEDIPVDAERLATRTAMKDVKKGKKQKQKAAKDAQL